MRPIRPFLSARKGFSGAHVISPNCVRDPCPGANGLTGTPPWIGGHAERQASPGTAASGLSTGLKALAAICPETRAALLLEGLHVGAERELSHFSGVRRLSSEPAKPPLMSRCSCRLGF